MVIEGVHMADPREYLEKYNNTAETMVPKASGAFNSPENYSKFNNTYDDKKPEQTAKAPENKPEDKKADARPAAPLPHDQAQWSEITANKQDTPSQPKEEKEKPKTGPIAIALTTSSLALTGTGNQVAEKSEDVRAMQKQLIALGYDIGSKSGEPDGYLGPKTREAAAEAMKKGGLDPATTTIAELTERPKIHLSYAEVKAEDDQKLAQRIIMTTSSADASPSQKRQPAHENKEVAWDPNLAAKYYDPKKLDDLGGKTTTSFAGAAEKPIHQQPTHALMQDMSLANVFKVQPS